MRDPTDHFISVCNCYLDMAKWQQSRRQDVDNSYLDQFGFVFGYLLNLPCRLSGGAVASQSRLQKDFQFFAPDETAESGSAPVHRSFPTDPAGSKTGAKTAE